jgi:hypothetical protein
MAIPNDELADMLLQRADADPGLVAVEAVLLRSALDRIDDWLCWLDEHTATTHTGDPSSTAVLQIIGAIRLKLRREIGTVDEALGRLEP